MKMERAGAGVRWECIRRGPILPHGGRPTSVNPFGLVVEPTHSTQLL